MLRSCFLFSQWMDCCLRLIFEIFGRVLERFAFFLWYINIFSREGLMEVCGNFVQSLDKKIEKYLENIYKWEQLIEL